MTPSWWTCPSSREKYAAPLAQPWLPTWMMAVLLVVVRLVARGVVVLDVGLADRHPLDVVGLALALMALEVGVVDADHLEHLQHPAVAEPTHLHRVCRRLVAVEAGGEAEVVLGEVEVALDRVEGDRLVGEPAGAADRASVRLALAGLVADGHLEDVAVPLLQRHVRGAGEVRPDVRAVHGLLAGDPRPPRHLAARAVHHRAVEAGVGADHLARAGDLDGRGAAAAHLVVRVTGPEGRLGVVDLVVADQQHGVVRAPEGTHAVVPAGQRGAVGQRRPATRCRGRSGSGTPRAGAAGRHRRGGP